LKGEKPRFLVNNSSKRKLQHPAKAKRRRSAFPLTPVQQLLWAGIGLALTIGGTFAHASITTVPWLWLDHGLQFQPLNVTYQLGMVLLIGCLGGPWAAAGSQLLYVGLGLVGLQIFTHGGGADEVDGAMAFGRGADLHDLRIERDLCFEQQARVDDVAGGVGRRGHVVSPVVSVVVPG